MTRFVILAYGLFCYALFQAVFLYLAGFLLEFFVPKGISDGVHSPVGQAVAINLGLIFLFGFTHSLMARKRFKEVWTKVIPPSAERSTYVFQSSVFLALAMWQWQPLNAQVWTIGGPAVIAVYAAFAIGLALVLVSTFLIDHFELFGLRQVWTAFTGRPMPKAEFRTPFLYRYVRHPMQLGIIILLFATPTMTAGHLMFASAMTAYIFVGLYFEERSLTREFGQTYTAYKARVPMLFPRLLPRRNRQLAGSA